MDQQTATEQVELSKQALNALLDARYADESTGKVDANRYPRSVVVELLDAGVVTYVIGKLVLTTKGATCLLRQSDASRPASARCSCPANLMYVADECPVHGFDSPLARAAREATS